MVQDAQYSVQIWAQVVQHCRMTIRQLFCVKLSGRADSILHRWY